MNLNLKNKQGFLHKNAKFRSKGCRFHFRILLFCLHLRLHLHDNIYESKVCQMTDGYNSCHNNITVTILQNTTIVKGIWYANNFLPGIRRIYR